jgi:hypothetical protein
MRVLQLVTTLALCASLQGASDVQRWSAPTSRGRVFRESSISSLRERSADFCRTKTSVVPRRRAFERLVQ